MAIVFLLPAEPTLLKSMHTPQSLASACARTIFDSVPIALHAAWQLPCSVIPRWFIWMNQLQVGACIHPFPRLIIRLIIVGFTGHTGVPVLCDTS